MPGAECLLLSNAGIFLRTAKSLTNSYGVAIIEDVHPGYYQVNDKLTVIFIYSFLLLFISGDDESAEDGSQNFIDVLV